MDERKKILIVDDEKDISALISGRLGHCGYDCIVANDPREGIKLAQEKKPDLILMDVLMPQMNGREACRLLKEDDLTKGIPVIFLTIKDSGDDVAAEFQAGAIGHVVKPIDGDELLTQIKAVIG